MNRFFLLSIKCVITNDLIVMIFLHIQQELGLFKYLNACPKKKFFEAVLPTIKKNLNIVL